MAHLGRCGKFVARGRVAWCLMCAYWAEADSAVGGTTM